MTKPKETERGFKEEEYYGWRCAEHMVDRYLAGCIAAYSYDSVFNDFKSQGSYGYILEHVPQDLGLAYLQNVQENNATLLVVEHNIGRAKKLADRLLLMDDGRLNPFITDPIVMEVK